MITLSAVVKKELNPTPTKLTASELLISMLNKRKLLKCDYERCSYVTTWFVCSIGRNFARKLDTSNIEIMIRQVSLLNAADETKKS